ncbi:hypothetical protein CC79DRAFT_440283 [Sarocladium strictum]
MRQTTSLLLALSAAASPAAAWLRHPFLNSGAEESWSPPRETNGVDADDDWTQAQVAVGWSPRPTDGPKPLFGRMLQPRLDDYTLGPKTCGFISSDANSFTCISDGATCTFSDDNIGCCEPNKDCNIIKTTCIDYDAVQEGSCNLPDDFHTLCCAESSLGACYTWVLSTTGSGGEDDHTFTLLDCAATSGTAILLDYDPAWSSTHIFSSKDDASTSTTDSSSSNTTEDPEAATSTGSSNNDDEGSSGGGSSTNVGAIAGGAVGGVAVLALIGVGVFFCLRRRKSKASSLPASTTAHMSQYGPVPTGPSGPASPGSTVMYPSGVPQNFQGYPPQQQQPYDPNMQYYNNGAYGQQQPQQYSAYGTPSPGYGQGHSPDYTQHGQQQGYGAPYNYQPSSMGSPPPPTGTSPSPGAAMANTPPNDGANNRHTASELPAVNPIGNENNRAELS